MNHASLFNGIGGFDLAAEWMGWNNVLSCEIDPFCNKVLAYHFPNAIHYEDIKKTDFTIHRGRIDILTGGFPCQPFSLAGKRKGTDDDRHLWPEMLRAIREVQPRWVVGENVYGFTNWSGGLVFRQVLSDLEDEGYEVQPFIIPACAVNAPHRRDRVWIVANCNKIQREPLGECSVQNNKQQQKKIRGAYRNIVELVDNGAVFTGWKFKGQRNATRPLFCRSGDGLSNWMDTYTVMGNAIVPQVAYEIFKAIQKYETL